MQWWKGVVTRTHHFRLQVRALGYEVHVPGMKLRIQLPNGVRILHNYELMDPCCFGSDSRHSVWRSLGI